MKDVSLLGNIVIDHVIHVDNLHVGGNNIVTKDFMRIGGVANMLPALADLDVHVHSTIGNDGEMKTVPTKGRVEFDWQIREQKTSFAHILVHGSSRTSVVDWGAGRNGKGLLPMTDTRWTHLAYIDVIKDLDIEAIKAKSAVVSADVCLSEPTLEDSSGLLIYGKYLDYLFISIDEFLVHAVNLGVVNPDHNFTKYDSKPFDSLREKIGVKNMVIHDDAGVVVLNDGPATTFFVSEKIHDVDTTGAGDIFAAFFIKKMLAKNGTIDKAVPYAQKKVANVLRERKNVKV